MLAGRWSAEVVRLSVGLSGLAGSYCAVAQILCDGGGIAISRASIWRQTQAWGALFRAVAEEERQRAMALPERQAPPCRTAVRDQRMGVALDGALLHIKEEGWKEFKIGAVFTAAVHAARGPTGDERRNVVHACDIRYVAHIGGSEALGELVWAEAQRRGWEHAHATLVLGDGAPRMWNQAALHFGASHQLVDWYHARHRLAAAGQALHGQNDAARQRWLDSRETHLYQGTGRMHR